MNLLQFATLMNNRAANLPANVASLKQAVAIRILTNLTEEMPIDTGRAASNNIVTLGGPAGFTRPPFAPGHKGSTKTETVRATIAAGVQVISIAGPGQTIAISNAVPYVRDLNDGSSRQAPKGFVESSVLMGRQVLIGAKVL